MKRVFCAVLLTATAFAVDSRPPEITAEQRARFWRAQYELLAAQLQAQQKVAALEAAKAELGNACREQSLTLGPSGEPVCTPRRSDDRNAPSEYKLGGTKNR